MKLIFTVLVLAAAPAVLGAAVQVPDQGNTPQSTSDSARSASDRSTSHDRHMRKHRATSHHHRHRATAKGNTH